MGGEHDAPSRARRGVTGSSPHGRGTPGAKYPTPAQCRIIPAWAGNTFTEAEWAGGNTDHPRMGGEHILNTVGRTYELGSSPHGRGTRAGVRPRTARRRIIPAWAGNTRLAMPIPRTTSDHPRMGGEHARAACTMTAADGSSPHGRGTRTRRTWPPTPRPSDHPRMGGEHARDSEINTQIAGSSPHGRGTPPDCPATPGPPRIIPAWAGNTAQRCPRHWPRADHPRMGGEHKTVPATLSSPLGSSPHGRGTLFGREVLPVIGRIIPAWAGNTALSTSVPVTAPDHPRMGGEHRAHRLPLSERAGSSPHGRGTRSWDRSMTATSRIIPAWAGNTSPARACLIQIPDHPRMGGEHGLSSRKIFGSAGSSPHGRGTLSA